MIRNFLFHRVHPVRDRLWDPMDVALFEKCIQYISKNYEVVLFEEFAFSEKLKSQKNVATIMFDDGYKDNIEYAAPILEKYGCQGSFYVVTDCINKNIPTWTYILEYLFQYTKIETISLDFDFLPGELKISRLKDFESRTNYVRKLKPFLKKLEHEKRSMVLSRVTEIYNDVELPKIMMNWGDLQELKSKGHYIGSHTATHSMLGTMENEKSVLDELILSGKTIEQELGYYPITISYPVGSYNSATKSYSQKAGYKIGLAVKQNVYNPEKEDLFEVSRIELYNEPWWKTRLRITNSLENIKSFIGYK